VRCEVGGDGGGEDGVQQLPDLVHGASLVAKDQSAPPLTAELSPGELSVLRYRPTDN
jgi:hypothetical protein